MALKHDDLKFSPTTHATAVIGSGTLGSRIALMLASSGGEVRLYDLNADQVEVARRYVEAELPRVVAGRSGAACRFASCYSRLLRAWISLANPRSNRGL